MRRWIVIFGIALMVFAFVILTLFIIAPAVVSSLDDAPLLRNIMQIAVCRPNEVLTAAYSTYSTPTSTTRTTDMSCVDSEHNARDVSQQIIGIGAIGYLGPFLIGLFMALLGRPDDKKQTTVPSMAVGIDVADRTARAQRLEALLQAREKSSGGVASLSASEQGQPGHLPLAQRLRELKEAFNAGLITEAEYKAKRKELLNES